MYETQPFQSKRLYPVNLGQKAIEIVDWYFNISGDIEAVIEGLWCHIQTQQEPPLGD
jgi:hypothetical protein